jgi:hypothetical protein
VAQHKRRGALRDAGQRPEKANKHRRKADHIDSIECHSVLSSTAMAGEACEFDHFVHQRSSAAIANFNPRSAFEASVGLEPGAGLDACVGCKAGCSTVRVAGSISEVRNRCISGCDMPSRPTAIF